MGIYQDLNAQGEAAPPFVLVENIPGWLYSNKGQDFRVTVEALNKAVGGSGKQFLVRVGKETIKMRAMTPREYARLQGVPDEYSITAKGVQALTGFGDAVCVSAISWIAKHVLNTLAENGGPLYKQQLPDAQLFSSKMTDNLSPEDRLKTMRAVKSKGTKLERQLWAMLAGMKLKGWKKNGRNSCPGRRR